MTYLGKEYKFEREENYEDYVKSLELPESEANKYLKYRPTLKLIKTGDTYTFSSITEDPETSNEYTFKSGVGFYENDNESNAKITFTIVDNTVSQIQQYDNGNVFTFKWEYSGDTLVEFITNNKWDGVARRYYKTNI